jgi:biopolymer transport protein ExbB
MLSDQNNSKFQLRCRVFVLLTAILVGSGLLTHSQVLAQADATINVGEGADEIYDGDGFAPTVSSDDTAAKAARFSLLSLLFKGGALMIPIMVMSVLVITLVIERFLNLSSRKILPKRLVNELGRLAASKSGFDPKQAYKICQAHPSSASTVIRSMLLKVGRPQSEVERAVSEASDREASRLYSNVRWLNLVAAVAPLVGLFGTVWGMIQAFFQTTQLTAGQNKSIFLAEGIYVALVTTLGGLAVAIPAAIFSHYFEGRIQSLFYQIDELLFNLMPQIEKFEGRLRMNKRDFGMGDNGDPVPQQQAAPPSQQPM